MKIDFKNIPKYTSYGSYTIDLGWDYLQEWINSHQIDLNPDFQRAHVWTLEQKTAYIEFCLRGGRSTNPLLFNCPGFRDGIRDDFVVVDGKQRIHAVLQFLNNDFPVFLYYCHKDIVGFPIHSNSTSFKVHVNNLKTRAEVLKWYIETNAGGTPHTEEEIEKVRKMLSLEIKGN